MRTVWFLAGGAAGVYATTKVRRAAEALTIDGIHDRLTGWFAGARVLHQEFVTAAVEKETELQERLGIVPDEHDNIRALPSSRTTSRGSARSRRQLTGKVED